MADRYWVGGTGSWDGTAGTKWAATSGGPGGESVPGSNDDVFFNAASGVVTVTVTANVFCKSLDFTGFTGTFAGSSNSIQVAGGNVTLFTGMTNTYSGNFTFASAGTATFTSAGKTVGPIAINFAGLTVTLGDALTSSGAITVTEGTFTTNNFNVTATSITSSNSNTRAINLGSSTVTLSGSTPIGFGTSTGLTLNAGTSTLNLTATNATLNGGTGHTFYNVSLTSTTATTTRQIQGANTFNNFTVAGPGSRGRILVTFNNSQTINGTLTATTSDGNRRIFFSGGVAGLRRTLTINSAPSLTNVDFASILVTGTAAPISGTRIGNGGLCSGITFDTPKTVYWASASGGTFDTNVWALSSGGATSLDNIPLMQDTAVIDNTNPATSTTVTVDSDTSYLPTVNMSARTNTLTFTFNADKTIYGSWINGTGVGYTAASVILVMGGEGNAVITCATRTLGGEWQIQKFGGTVELTDNFATASGRRIVVVAGTFDTKGFTIDTGSFITSADNYFRTVKLGNSTLNLSGGSPLTINRNNLVFDAGTSQINLSDSGADISITGSGDAPAFYNVSFTGTSTAVAGIGGPSSYNNVTFAAPGTSPNFRTINIFSGVTITGTLTVAGGSAVRRQFLSSPTLGVPVTLTVGTLLADDCDFRDIIITGTAVGTSPTRAGNCGGNSGINFPAPKTVYWNLSGTQNWTATAWATTSSGTPAVNNYPLPQDTAVFTNSGAAGTVTVGSRTHNVSSIDASARTSAMTLASGSNTATFYGSYILGSGVTISGTTSQTFSGSGTQTFTSAGKTITFPILVFKPTTSLFQLGDALSTSNTLAVSQGIFDAVTYNVTVTTFTATSSNTEKTVKMGSGLWTLSGTGNAWNLGTSLITFEKGTADILFSNTTTTARTFTGAGFTYNKLTIGGATGTSTLTFANNSFFSELASTKTVAHTIAFGSTRQRFGKWTVTGTAGNVVTLTGTGTTHEIYGPATSGIDYIAMGSIVFDSNSPGEFFAGANSTGLAQGANRFTAAPTPRTLYWVGGTGNWSDTAKWSLSSGGAGGEPIPTTLDDVIFDSASNATSYTMTADVPPRSNSLTMNGPASGNLTFSGSLYPFISHGNVTLAATGVVRGGQATFILSGDTSLKTLNIPITLAQDVVIRGLGCNWQLGGPLNISNGFIVNVECGTFSTANYAMDIGRLESKGDYPRSISLGSSAIEVYDQFANDGPVDLRPTNLTFDAGTSTITYTGSEDATFEGAGFTFYNVVFDSSTGVDYTITGANTFNNLTVNGLPSNTLDNLILEADQTITGTLTFSAGADATARRRVRSDEIGITRTLTCGAFSGSELDFRDITIAGAAAPISGTSFGDCKGNSGITFPSPKTVYWALSGNSGNWATSNAWATSSGGTPNINNFPLPQDTAVFDSTYPDSGATIIFTGNFGIGTIDMSARTSNTMTLSTSTHSVYGNWVNGTGVTLTGTGAMIFAGRGSQTITSAGVTFTQIVNIDSPGGSVTLQDAFLSNRNSGFSLLQGTFDANIYNVTFTGTTGSMNCSGSLTRTLALGSGTWSINGTGTNWNVNNVNFTLTGTGTINITANAASSFSGGSVSYSGITLNHSGAGVLSITGNNTFANITTSGSADRTINFAGTTQRVANFTAAGTSGSPSTLLKLTGNNSSTSGTLIYTGASTLTSDYLSISNVRAYGPNGEISGIWTANLSQNFGSLGWDFTGVTPPPPAANANFFLMFA